MKVVYTGRTENFTPAQEKKLAAKFSKLARLLDRRGGEREAHVILTGQRHLQQAEITVNFSSHPLVGVATSTDQFTAILAAAEKLEKQALKLRTRRRDTKRVPKNTWPLETAEGIPQPAEAEAFEASGRRVFRVTDAADRKPMTLEEALLEMADDRDYFVYRDAETDRISVLVRRRDGHFDLIEA
ncbi:MAG: ribosome-associated translation inhibitor RaiA [Bryobacterales bacterium]|nr:ribosome-associated translation inhibitor RaiA [Bryobacteraceae bacterium]MDW8353669.1 ribosome-associated translation inhibitor RaiA [Bryobacterales bacterium]